MAQEYDVIVVGAGIEGSATAYHSALNNKTLLLEQFPLPHSRGSSHGQTRIIRKAYYQEHYSRIMPTAYKQWEELERQEGTKIIVNTGLLNIGSRHDSLIDEMEQAMVNTRAPHTILNSKELAQRYPMLNIDPDEKGLYDPDAGVIRADIALRSFWSQYKKRGGTIHDGETVTSITPGSTVIVTTTKRQYRTKSVVLCLGPWTSKLTKPLGLHLPLQPVRIGVYYWKTRTDQFTVEKGMPCLIYADPGKHIYSLPAMEYPNLMKLCLHTGVEIDPENRDSQSALSSNNKAIQDLGTFIKSRMPGLEPVPSITESCIYTVTPDEDLILDSHPQWKNIIIGAGFSGHGFKMAPVVGMVLTELATGKRPSFDLTPMSIDRFFKTSKL